VPLIRRPAFNPHDFQRVPPFEALSIPMFPPPGRVLQVTVIFPDSEPPQRIELSVDPGHRKDSPTELL